MALKEYFRKPAVSYCYIYGSNSFSEWVYTFKSLFLPKMMIREDATLLYEQKICTLTGADFSHATGSGRMALYSILKALNFDSKDEILIPAYTCVVVPNAVLYAGLKPVYVDVDMKNFVTNLSYIRPKITINTKVIYLQNTFGIETDLTDIVEYASQLGLWIIVDAAHGPIISDQAKNVIRRYKKSVYFFSTDRSKYINTILGGFLITNNDELYKTITSINQQLNTLSKNRIIKLKVNFLIEYFFTLPLIFWFGDLILAIFKKIRLRVAFLDEKLTRMPENYPVRISNFQSEIGLRQLDRIGRNKTYRGEMVEIYERFIGWQSLSDHTKNTNKDFLRYSFVVKNRKDLPSDFTKMFSNAFWFSSPFQGREKDFCEIFYAAGSCPNSEYLADHIVNLPTHERINKKIVTDFLIKNGKLLRENLAID
ncbi:MAG: DegT/DnrJ/EryC1/StrS aminotransferase family protein [Flavobacterium sp.]|nr:MAG: DegT/DnrJ/EryC1/StrS aminotransferase family protein [Flavobacterium sp.]